MAVSDPSNKSFSNSESQQRFSNLTLEGAGYESRN